MTTHLEQDTGLGAEGAAGAATDRAALRRAAREGALVQPMPSLGTLVVTGSERTSWLNGLVTCDLAKLAPWSAGSGGGGAYGLSVQKSGKILAEVWIVVSADRLLVGAESDRLGLLHETFDRYLIMEDAELSDASAEHAWAFSHGPLSGAVAAAGRAAGAEVAHVDWTGLGGALVVTPRDAAAGAEAAMRGAGAPIEVVSPEAWDTLRVEFGLPRFGVDFDDQSYPQEASLEGRAVSFNKGCYLGQETVFMLQMRGHAKKRLVPIEIEGEADVPAGAEITLPEGGAVGSITSRVPDPRRPALLALGYVKYKHATPGAALVVAGRPARVGGCAAG